MRSRSIGRPTDCGWTVQKQEVPVWMARLNTEYESCRFWEKRLSTDQPLAHIKAPTHTRESGPLHLFGGITILVLVDNESHYIVDQLRGPMTSDKAGPQAETTAAKSLDSTKQTLVRRAANDRPTYCCSPPYVFAPSITIRGLQEHPSYD
jgi:hypothetical protein